MLLLYETAAGYALFKVKGDERWLKSHELGTDISIEVDDSKLGSIFDLFDFQKFEDTAQALKAATLATEGEISHPLKKLLKKLVKRDIQDPLMVADAKLGQAISKKFSLSCLTSIPVQNLMRSVRENFSRLFDNLEESNADAMRIGLAHSMSRFKLKFTAEKADILVVQAISLLDEIDKDLNNYIMRTREWYGCHFPELCDIIPDHVMYAKVARSIGLRDNADSTDLSDIIGDEALETKVKEASQTSIGTELSEADVLSVRHLCDQVIRLSEYRSHLHDYLKNRMFAIAPNLSVLVGELLAARLIAKAGSLTNLAKHPASTVQILGAEKALFRALKTKHDTPKYGLMFHASLVGKTSQKLKGKVCRMLAAKSALAARYDALADTPEGANDPNCCDFGIKARASLESRVYSLEQGKVCLWRQFRKSCLAKGCIRKGEKRFQSVEGSSEYVSSGEIGFLSFAFRRANKYDTGMDSTLSTRKRHQGSEDVESVKRTKI